jgi:acyl-CoA thioester hydrolase
VRLEPSAQTSRELLDMLTHHDASVRVRYAETDQMGVVYHSNYLVWFEVGRVELMRSLGFDYKRMEIDDDTFIVVADVHCRYHHPARYDELLTVRSRILEAKTRTLKFGYEILRQEDQKLLATGHTIHVACSRAGHVKHFPEKYKDAFLSVVEAAANRGKE